MSNSLRTHGLQHVRPLCPSPTPRVYSNSCPLSQWCHSTISSSVIPFSSHRQSFPASGSFPMSQLFVSGGQSIGVSASASVLPMDTQDWFPLGWKYIHRPWLMTLPEQMLRKSFPGKRSMKVKKLGDSEQGSQIRKNIKILGCRNLTKRGLREELTLARSSQFAVGSLWDGPSAPRLLISMPCEVPSCECGLDLGLVSNK